jgi:hypothetical protein
MCWPAELPLASEVGLPFVDLVLSKCQEYGKVCRSIRGQIWVVKCATTVHVKIAETKKIRSEFTKPAFLLHRLLVYSSGVVNVIFTSVGIALGYGLEDWGPRFRLPVGAGNFSLHHRVQNGSWSTQRPIQCVPGALSMGVKRLGREADHSPPRSKNDWSYTSTPQYAFMAWCLLKVQGQLYLYQFVIQQYIPLNWWASTLNSWVAGL